MFGKVALLAALLCFAGLCRAELAQCRNITGFTCTFGRYMLENDYVDIQEPLTLPGDLLLLRSARIHINVSAGASLTVNGTLRLISARIGLSVPLPELLRVDVVYPLVYGLREGSIFESVDIFPIPAPPDCNQVGVFRLEYTANKLAVFYLHRPEACSGPSQPTDKNGLSELDVLLMGSLLVSCVVLVVVFLVTPLPHWVYVIATTMRELRHGSPLPDEEAGSLLDVEDEPMDDGTEPPASPRPPAPPTNVPLLPLSSP